MFVSGSSDVRYQALPRALAAASAFQGAASKLIYDVLMIKVNSYAKVGVRVSPPTLPIDGLPRSLDTKAICVSFLPTYLAIELTRSLFHITSGLMHCMVDFRASYDVNLTWCLRSAGSVAFLRVGFRSA